jgi:hypothetical protein
METTYKIKYQLWNILCDTGKLKTTQRQFQQFRNAPRSIITDFHASYNMQPLNHDIFDNTVVVSLKPYVTVCYITD